MGKPKLYYHIGSPKTGTTSLQHFFNDNYNYLIKNFKIYYPCCENDPFFPEENKIILTNSFFKNNEVRHSNGMRILRSEDPFNIIKRIAQLATEMDLQIVFSDESISMLSHPCNPFIGELKKYFDIIPIVEIKDPLEYMFSSYLETIKRTSFYGSFAEYMQRQLLISPQFTFYKDWCNSFSDIKIISFNKIKVKLIENILLALGCSEDKLNDKEMFLAYRKNVSLDAGYYHIKKRLNQLGLNELARKFTSSCDNIITRKKSPKADSAYRELAFSCHKDMFTFLSENLLIDYTAFLANDEKNSNCEVIEMDVFSSDMLDLLLGSISEVRDGKNDETEKYAMAIYQKAENTILNNKDGYYYQRIVNMSPEQSIWGSYCPKEFSVFDYLELNTFLKAIPYEDFINFDPYMHYSVYGQYSGLAIKKCLSIDEQVLLFSKSPYSSYVPYDFGACKYLQFNHDVHEASVDPYFHYAAHGIKEKRIYR